jgi:hypothetical protein
MTDLTVEDYSEKSIVVRGETREHKDALKSLGGKWNARLRDGGGWIFSKKCEANVMEYVASGNITAPDWQTNQRTKSPSKRVRNAAAATAPPSEDIAAFRKEVRRLTKKLAAVESALNDKLDRILLLLGEEEEADVEIEVSSDDETPAPMKRLLK